MNALIMCGGKGTRLRPAVGDTEKPLVEIGDKPLIDRVADAVWRAKIRGDTIETVHAAVSPATPATAAHLHDDDRIRCLETAGEGYVADLIAALDHVGRPALTVTADLPFLTASHVERASRVAGGDSLTVCVPASLTASLGVSAETTIEHEQRTVVPTGLNVVGKRSDERVIWADERLAFNINRPSDLDRARGYINS